MSKFLKMIILNYSNTMRHDEPEIYLVAKRIADYVDSQLDTNSNDDELFYLMIYVKRIVNKINTQA
ncbi:PRD domain-containing protein [Lactiplantibacillus plantarum]|uniref:PRD domain-containing protein n=1 Tax=Lactiplantibacillus plantarum TaxID=1590 RepID=UPI0029166151|nr:PRD domain-containing protein [Lactiplantibacillus plantarum]